jgi:hypothetical protein
MADSDASSTVSSSNLSDVENLIYDQPMYYVLNQFLMTEDGTNIATCIQELTKEVKDLKKIVSSFAKQQGSASGR